MKGRKRVALPASRVVIATRSVSTAKWTTARRRSGFVGVAIAPVLLDRLVDALPGDGVLQLGRGHRDAVDEQAQVDGLGRTGLVRKLAGHGQPVLAVALQERRREAGRRPKERQPDGHAQVDDPVADHVDRAAGIQLLGQPVGKAPLRLVRVAAVEGEQPVPLLDLRGPDEREQLRRVERPHRIEVRRRPLRRPHLDRVVPARVDQPVADERLERRLVDFAHAAAPGMSISPVTAAVMRA